MSQEAKQPAVVPEGVLDQTAAEKKHEEFVAKAEGNLALKLAVEKRNEAIRESERAEFGIHPAEAERILGKLAQEGRPSERDTRETVPKKLLAPEEQVPLEKRDTAPRSIASPIAEPEHAPPVASRSRRDDQRKLSLGLLLVIVGTIAAASLIAFLAQRGEPKSEKAAEQNFSAQVILAKGQDIAPTTQATAPALSSSASSVASVNGTADPVLTGTAKPASSEAPHVVRSAAPSKTSSAATAAPTQTSPAAQATSTTANTTAATASSTKKNPFIDPH